DNWNESQPGVGGNGWYRIDIHLDHPPDRLWAVHLQRLRMNAAVFVNGVFVGDGGRFVEPVSRNWNRPLYFPIPKGLLHQGRNRLHVRILAEPNVHGGLFALQVGPDDVLKTAYWWRFFLKVDLNLIFTTMTVIMGLFITTLWVRWRQEPTYGWLAGTMLLWAANNTHYFVRDLPISTWEWEWTAQVGTDCFAVLLAVSVHRFLGLRRPMIEGAMFVYLGIVGLILAFVELDRMMAVANLLHIGAVAIGAYMVGTLLWHSWQQRFCGDTVALAVAVTSQAILGAHDWLLQLGVWQQDRWYLMHYASPVLFAVLTWLLTSRFVQALNESKALNIELEQRVAEKHQALEEGYRKLRVFEQQQAVAEERDRIMRDLHDGLGGHLVSALALVEQNGQAMAVNVEQTLRDALDDLRLVIDSLDPDSGDLPVLLGMIRMRIETRMSRQGLCFNWQVQDVPPLPGFSPEMALHILRIVQEAFANILKHAQARTITVRTGENTSGDGRTVGVYLEVCDDGRGIQNGSRGRGLNNMQRRARSIGGTLDVASDAQGTRVRLWLPLRHAA
ncbi:MAG: ATP-binding protein, partial [Candidatus Binatia bacterium]